MLLAGLLDRTPPGDPARRQILRSLAVQRGVRFISFHGTEEDRVAGMAYARECLTLPPLDGPDDSADISHFVLAWLTLTRQATGEQRSVEFRQAEVEAARRDGEASKSLLAQLGTLTITPDDARAALGHLRQMSAAPADEGIQGMKSMLWTLALLATREEEAGGDVHAAGHLRHVADELDRLAGLLPQDADALLAARAALLVTHARIPEGAGQRAQAAAPLDDAAARLPAGHPARTAASACSAASWKAW